MSASAGLMLMFEYEAGYNSLGMAGRGKPLQAAGCKRDSSPLISQSVSVINTFYVHFLLILTAC